MYTALCPCRYTTYYTEAVVFLRVIVISASVNIQKLKRYTEADM